MGRGSGARTVAAAGRPKVRPATDLGRWPGQQKKWVEADALPTPGTKRAAAPAPLGLASRKEPARPGPDIPAVPA